MEKIPVIAIFDVGKTNKKLFLFDEQYRIVWERSAHFSETVDEDGDACENLESLRASIFDSLSEVVQNKEFEIRAIHFSSYGASLVYLDENEMPLTPLYNYLKKYPPALQDQFYTNYGGVAQFSMETASPALGSLNSGLQLYRLKYDNPLVFDKVKYVLHLPQYLSFLISGIACSEITSIGCHTCLWDFKKNDYHDWVRKENLLDKLQPIRSAMEVVQSENPENPYLVGVGLHDSSAALIPYLVSFREPFMLISTGTWCITLNPFDETPLTREELEHDCLQYLSYKGIPVKASRIFAGNEHEQQVKRIAEKFDRDPHHYKSLAFDAAMMARLRKKIQKEEIISFSDRDLSAFHSDTEAYHQLMLDIAIQQFHSTRRVMQGLPVKRIFVDGGFSGNSIYMHLLAILFPEMEVFAASVAQATALGAALAIHAAWNTKSLPDDIIELRYFAPHQVKSL